MKFLGLLGFFAWLVDSFQTPIVHSNLFSVGRQKWGCSGTTRQFSTRGIVALSASSSPLTDSVWFRLYVNGVETGLTKTKVGEGADITDIARSIKAECSTLLTNVDASVLKLYAHNSDDAPLDPTFLWNVLSHGGDASRPMIVKAQADVPSDTTNAAAVLVAQVASPEKVLKALLDQGYSKGMIEAMMNHQQIFARCIWIVDNSGSMSKLDGHRIVLGPTSESPLQFMECSRWTEMQQTVEYHAEMAALLQSPTTFRLLNDPGRFCGPQIFSIASNDSKGKSIIDDELSVALSTMQKSKPGGVTPLTRQILDIQKQIVSMQSQLQEDRTKVAIVIATDGLPSDASGQSDSGAKREFVAALRSLVGLPVWIVVRLSTDEDEVVQYWNEMDSQLELSLEVLDDFESEAVEVYEVNPWLTYGLPLHRMRELGFHDPLLDMLDERQLSSDEVRDFLCIVLGRFEAPDPDKNWKGYCAAVETLLAKETKQWNPILKKVMPWINVKELDRLYAPVGSTLF